VPNRGRTGLDDHHFWQLHVAGGGYLIPDGVQLSVAGGSQIIRFCVNILTPELGQRQLTQRPLDSA
jgi:hypothetical protein